MKVHRIVLPVLGLVPACQQAAGLAASGGGGESTIPVLGPVFIVVEENTDSADVMVGAKVRHDPDMSEFFTP